MTKDYKKLYFATKSLYGAFRDELRPAHVFRGGDDDVVTPDKMNESINLLTEQILRLQTDITSKIDENASLKIEIEKIEKGNTDELKNVIELNGKDIENLKSQIESLKSQIESLNLENKRLLELEKNTTRLIGLIKIFNDKSTGAIKNGKFEILTKALKDAISNETDEVDFEVKLVNKLKEAISSENDEINEETMEDFLRS